MKELFEYLNSNQIRFLIIGSYSKLWNNIGTTYPRDIDIWIEESDSNRIKFLESFGLNLSGENIGQVIIRTIKVNIFLMVDGLKFEFAFSNANVRQINEELEVKYLSAEHYIQNISTIQEKWDF